MGQLDGQVVFISGVARGQGRSHALTLAKEGASVIGFDLCDDLTSTAYPGATDADLKETRRLLTEVGARSVLSHGDVRDYAQVEAAFQRGLDEFGRVDIIIPNAGLCAGGKTWELSEEAWRETIDINLTGVWHTVKAAVPTLIEQGEGGSVVFIGSTEALKGAENMSVYAASKHGVTGLMTSLSRELGQYNIRVNSVNPTCVDTNMIQNPYVWGLFQPDNPSPTRESVEPAFTGTHILPVPWMEPIDVSRAILYLVGESGRYITASTLTIDAGFIVKS
ncbi:mycofactocin-coupled SDR family oxidoreductase [Gordonia terrae]|uniref:NAD(P)-dependent oxidoreductase n=2 Tax=Gordonia terrae TaxID=2055 RepID=A0AAD0KA81_9ACTN|nr:mycofactocin-coupled SDR family oxidoreductase [Gordonia terrae]VTR08862.1 2-dehydro-3-deoxy-D-gluconate 5-dehydrogenase KduD [Clostridioides difficile]ANY21603.1 3-ketoacyl-ACP reductase [Gordonia terrae]AWO82331.1 NAD(P)-dependent oxidoreductase [Gordonia terrae]VTS17484.1 (-)-trans-carveol dehydrogenase [Gordonia terrae]GAB44600.1 putative carveol dehydrogenase [Gordonia terrae NBRC 100016]